MDKGMWFRFAAADLFHIQLKLHKEIKSHFHEAKIKNNVVKGAKWNGKKPSENTRLNLLPNSS